MMNLTVTDEQYEYIQFLVARRIGDLAAERTRNSRLAPERRLSDGTYEAELRDLDELRRVLKG